MRLKTLKKQKNSFDFKSKIDENKTYESVQLFKNEYDLEKFLSNKDHLTELQNAKC